mmetsp:Transcript_2186/g.5081  ORF Transcript_2186/g.5081 Transcript_2186/m.5081 type:complete len:171 (-) Transcript_2186:151-663(-)|eukprot:2774134-Rhodomonas_salina.1
MVSDTIAALPSVVTWFSGARRPVSALAAGLSCQSRGAVQSGPFEEVKSMGQCEVFEVEAKTTVQRSVDLEEGDVMRFHFAMQTKHVHWTVKISSAADSEKTSKAEEVTVEPFVEKVGGDLVYQGTYVASRPTQLCMTWDNSHRRDWTKSKHVAYACGVQRANRPAKSVLG